MKKCRKLLTIFAASLLLASCGDKTEPQNEQQEQQQGDAASDAQSDDSATDQEQSGDAASEDKKEDASSDADDGKTDQQKEDDAQSDEPEEKVCPAGFTGENCDECIDGTTDAMIQDGVTYPAICINKIFWTTKNMNYPTGTYYHVDGNSDNDATFGLLYDWETANTVCATGWHLPSKDDYMTELVDYVEQSPNRTSEDSNLALMAKSTAWIDYSEQGGDDFGFAALPGGYSDLVDEAVTYQWFGQYGYFWASNSSAEGTKAYIILGGDLLYMYFVDENTGRSVRCIKDAN